MPETNELQAHYETAEHYREKVLVPADDLEVLEEWCDSTADEDKNQQLHHPKDDHIFKMGPDNHFVRGNRSSPTQLAPKETLRPLGSAETPPTIRALGLKWLATYVDGRALYFDFGDMYLKTAPLTHTSLQCYTREIWENSIMKVNKWERGFKVGLALEFRDYFIVFVSNDLVFQPQWIRHDPALVGKSPVERFGIANDVLRDYEGMVAGIVNWMRERRSGRRARGALACDAMRAASTVWVGLGVYTACEVFNIAGVSLHLSEREVFDCPSRTARLCEAFWTWANSFRGGFGKYVKPTICKKTHLLAPTVNQRLKYKDQLAVYGKTEIRMSPRRAGLLRNYTVKLDRYALSEEPLYRDEVTDLFDVYDPGLMIEALTLSDPSKRVAFGHLIFGQRKWEAWGYKCLLNDALTKAFIEFGLWLPDAKVGLEATTHLNIEAYDQLANPSGETFCTLDTYLYLGGMKQMWCAIPGFPKSLSAITRPPPNPPKPKPRGKGKKRKRSEADDEDDEEELNEEEEGEYDTAPSETKKKKKELILATGEEKRVRTLEYIITNTKEVAIGPLEYAGHGKAVRGPKGVFRRLAVNGDPRLPNYFRVLSLWPIFVGKGENQQKMTATQQKKLIRRASKPMRSSSPLPSSSSPAPSPTKILASMKWLKRGTNGGKTGKENVPLTPPRKKFKRLHSDRKLAMGIDET